MHFLSSFDENELARTELLVEQRQQEQQTEQASFEAAENRAAAFKVNGNENNTLRQRMTNSAISNNKKKP